MKKIILVTPWFGEFAGGAEIQAKGIAVELNKRGIETMIFTTCSKSPYDSWWDDFYAPGEYTVYGLRTVRFRTNDDRYPYENAVSKFVRGEELTEDEKESYFISGINSDDLIRELDNFIDKEYEIICVPYFQGLSHACINAYPEKISLIPCFHNEPQFYWDNTENILHNSKYIFYNSPEEKELAVKVYGTKVGRKVVEGPVTGEGVELPFEYAALESKDANVSYEIENYILYLGRKEKGKNVHILCDWFVKYVAQSKSSLKLVFVGGGDVSILPDHPQIIDYGFVSEKDKYYLIQKALSVINLSMNESFSLVIMESWLMSRPVVVHAHCAVTRGHAIRSNGGLYVADEFEFITSLQLLEQKKEIADKLGQSGCQYVQGNFNYDSVLEKYLGELKVF